MNRFLCVLATGLYLCLQVDAESHLSRSVIERAVIAAKANVDSAYLHSRTTGIERLRRQTVSPSDTLRFLKQPYGETRNAVRAAEYMENAVSLLKKSMLRRQKRSINATDLISKEDLEVIAKLTGCSARFRAPSCEDIPYLHRFRPANGICNNRNSVRWGSSNIPFVRWLPADYQNDFSLPKGWDPEMEINNYTLPLVREVSNQILRTANSDVRSDPLYTFLVTIFGQWTDHDLTFTPHSPVIRSFSNGIDCDKSCERTEPCFPIEIPMTDSRLEECMPFFRSAPACGSGETGYIFGARTVRQQMNALTAFIDVGQVYGSDDVKARFLRDLYSDKGLLKVNMEFTDNGRELLPFTKLQSNMCATRAKITGNSIAKEVPCFEAGDVRANENIALTSLHTLLLREHNRLARALAQLNPYWNGERLYQEARKIMGAYFQVLTFRDYLPHIVGPDIIASQLSSYPGYDEYVDPSISNVFATVAYRFAHMMVQPFMFRLDEQYNDHPDFPSILLHKAFFTPWRIVDEGGVDHILRGLVGRKAKLMDHMMPDELRDRLFEFSSALALDLASLNMQRGRDHGIPGYNKWRGFCGLSQPQNVSELAAVMNNSELAVQLVNLYGTPDNIDVWLGGISEPFVVGGRVGPLFACLIATQFKRIRQGDKLWWEGIAVFTDAQRESLRNTSFARIICDNTGITEVPEKPFEYNPRGSGYTQCIDIPEFDLSPWKEGGVSLTGPPGPPGPRGPPGIQGPPGPPGNMEKIAFSVRLGNDFPRSGKPILFRENIYNVDNTYNTDTGVFVCKVSGVYEFQFFFNIAQINSDNDALLTVSLMCNFDVILESVTGKLGAPFTTSGSVYIKLQSGDKVWLMAGHGRNGLTKNSYFSGKFLFVP